MAVKLSSSERSLIRRYLLWCYKTTKESLDRIDRKFTQAKADRQILKYLNNQGQQHDVEYSRLISNFEKYIANKEQDGVREKFLDANSGILKSDYLYLQCRLEAIEKAISYFLGVKDLAAIQASYEQEMTRRILESREH